MLMLNTSDEYASITKRLCARRLLCFLRRHYLECAAHQLEKETTVFFDRFYLRFLASSARWAELDSYVYRFFPFNDRDRPPSIQSLTFMRTIHFYRVLFMIASGGSEAESVDRLYPLLDAAAAKADPYTAKLRSFFHDVRRRPPRDYAAWLQIWQDAAKRLEQLALQCPELKGKLSLPHHARCTPKTWQINLSGMRPILRPYKKEVKRKACVVASWFDEKREEINRSIAGLSSNETTESMRSGVQTKATVHEAPGVDTSVAAGVLGGDGGQLGSKEVDKTCTSTKKRKESETPPYMADVGDAATRSVKARKDDSSLL